MLTLRVIVLYCLLIVSTASSHVLKSDQNSFFNLLNDYNEQSVFPKLDENYASDRVLRHMGDNTVICEVITSREVFDEEGYEFQPTYYVNQTCTSTNIDPYKLHSGKYLNRVICLHNDNKFGCQTVYEEMNVWKKNLNEIEECKEHTMQLVAVGCKCNIRYTYNRG